MWFEFMQTIFKNNLMALDKTMSIQHAIQDGSQSGSVIWSQFIKWLPSSFPKIAFYFKLNYFKLIHLQANMLSSLIVRYFAANHTNLPQKLSSGLGKHKI